MMNTKGLGYCQQQLLTFAKKCNGWHSYSKDYETVRVAKSLEKRGCIELNSFYQFRLVRG